MSKLNGFYLPSVLALSMTAIGPYATVMANDVMSDASDTTKAKKVAMRSSTTKSPVHGKAGTRGAEEILVTAAKKKQRLQDVPVSVSAVNPTQLIRENLVQTRDYITRIPGVAINEGAPGMTQIVMRGLATGNGGNPLVGITIDDVPFGSATFAGWGSSLIPDLDPADLQQIEVLRGPQGTLYGASAMGGLLKYTTAVPSLTRRSARIESDVSGVVGGGIGYGFRGYGSTPVLNKRVAISISGFDRVDPAYISDPQQNRKDVNAVTSYGGRVALNAQITDRLSFHAAALTQDKSAGASSMVDVYFDHKPVYGIHEHGRNPATDSYHSHVNFYDGTLAYDFGPVTLSALTGYSQYGYDSVWDYSRRFQGLGESVYGLSGLGYRFENHVKNKKFSEEVKLSSRRLGPIQFMAGAFYTHEDTVLSQNIDPISTENGNFLDLPVLLHASIPTTYKEVALFGNITWYVTKWFDIELGGRFSHIDQVYTERDDGIMATPAHGIFGDSPMTYTVTPVFHISKEMMFYGRIASGYRAGGPNPAPVSTIPNSYAPDTTINYEIGLKGSVLSKHLTYDLSVYRINWHNIQISETDEFSGNTYFANAGNAQSQGFEATLRYMPIDGLTMQGNISFTEASLLSNAPANAAFVAWRGDQLPYAPRWSANLAVDYDRPLTEMIDGFAGFTVAFTDRRFGAFRSEQNLQRFVMPAYATVDLRVGLRVNRWTGTLVVKNVGNKVGFLGYSELTATQNGPYAVSINQPRTIGFSVSRSF